ncbi:MAG: hypothetical protein II825_02370 [Paludibacteraceae bacterium]|nr:hypothetical protein [Paludibacteraceae bacterium]
MRNFTQTLKFFFLACALVLASNTWGQTYNGSTWYSLYTDTYSTTTAWTTTENPTVYAPTTKTMQIGWKESARGAGFDLWVNDDKIASSTIFERHTSDQTATASIGVDVSSVKVSCYCSLTGYFGKYRIPLAQHIRLVSGTYGTTSVTKNFGDVEWGTSKSYKVNFRSFLTNGNITVSIVGDDNGDFSFSSSTHGVHSLTKSDKNRSFSVGANMCASENGATNTICSIGVLGRAAEYDFTVYYYPKKENVGRSYTDNNVYVKITDGKSTAKVILRGNCVKRNQTIVWDNSDATYNTTDNITYNAVANDAISGTASGVSVTYAPTSGSPAYMSGNALQIVTSGNTTITASAAANTYYNAATNVTKKITINKVTPTVTWPEIASGLKYNESCAVGDKVSDHWTGGSAKDDKNTPVSGTFVCDAALVPANTSYSVTFNPTNPNWYNSVSTTISGVVAKGDQTIDWSLADATTNPATEYATGQLMGATASSGLPVTYTPNAPGDGVAGYINENGRLVVVEPNKEITITASQAGNDNWNEAPNVTKTFTTKGAHSGLYTEDVEASDITYGDLLSASVLSGNVLIEDVVIPGTLEWVDPAIMPNAGEANHMVLFTPENTDAYSPFYFELPVTVGKADPVFTWHISNALHEHTRFHHFVTSSNAEAGLTYSVSNSTYIEVVGEDVLHTKGVNGSVQSGLVITVEQAETDNYKYKTETKTVTVYPKVEQCLPAVVDNETTMNHMGSVFNPANSGSWCNVTNVVDATYLRIFSVKYTQYKGIRLGKWSDGFSGIKDFGDFTSLVGNWNLVPNDKSIELTFTGVPDSISFSTILQTVQYDLFGWQTAPLGNPNPSWTVYEKPLGGEYTYVTSLSVSDTENHNIKAALKPTTRFVKITLNSVFAGFAQNVKITRKQYIKTDVPSLNFGTNTNPLQEPQALTLMYSSIGDCDGENDNDHITISCDNPAFYVDESFLTEDVGIEQMNTFMIRVRCNEVGQTGTLTIEGSDGTSATVALSSETPVLAATPITIFETGTEHEPLENTAYRAEHTHNFSACFNEYDRPLFDTLYIYGVSESAADSREWEYSPAKGYKVPVVNASNVHTPCFVYKKENVQYTYVRTFDAAKTTLNIADFDKKLGFVGYKPASLSAAIPAIQINGTNNKVYFNNTEIISSGAVLVANGTQSIYARGANSLTSASNAAVQLSGTTTLGIEDNWKSDEASAVLALRPAAGYPSIDLGSANGRVNINGTQLELHNATNMAIAHMDGTTEKFDGEVHITDGSVGGEEILGMPKLTFIDGGTFNDGTVNAYTLKGVAKRPRNSRGEIVSRHTMAPAALADGYSWYGQSHLTLDGSAKVNPMLMDEEVWIFNGTNSDHSDDATSWNKGSVPGETADVLINAPMVVSGGELKVKSLTINWEDKGKGIPAVTVNPNGGLTVGEGGIDAIKLANPAENLVLKAGETGETKGQTGFLRIHPESAEPMPKATVQLYSIGYYDKSSADTDENNVAAWQYVGTPIDFKGALAKTVFTRSWIYSYDESSDSWVNNRKNLVMQPFVGYATTQYDSEAGKLLEYKGELIPNTGTHTINLEYSASNGYNVVANSFAAPIDITKMRNTDFVNVDDPTIYLFHTGTHKQAEDNLGTEGSSAGQFISIAIGTAGEMATLFADDDIPTTIAPMQGFGIYASGAGGQVNLDYTKLVWNANYAEHPNKPLRAPQLHEETDAIEEVEITGALRMTISADGCSDKCYLLESESYDTLYEAGYDASKKMSGRLNIFTVAEDKQLAINATNSIEGTRVGVRTGEETTYTFRFNHIQSDKDLVLWDKETKMKVFIDEDIEYTFYAVPNSEITERFQIVAANIPTITTGTDEIESETKVQKFIKDNQLYILKDGVLYNATGAVVRK